MDPSPAISTQSKLRFWLTYLLGLLGFGYALIFGGLTLRGDPVVMQAGLILAVTGSITWLVWRGFIKRDRLPRTGLEVAFGAGLAAVALSLAFSPDMRQGFEHSGWLLGYVLFFFFFLNVMASGLDRWALLAAGLTVTGLILFHADNDTLQWYRAWFAAAGGWILPPTQYRFTGLLGNSNITMGMANLFMPVALLAIGRFRRPLARVLCGLWIVLYLVAVPFASSRGGWLGLLVALALSGAYWIWQAGLVARIRRWPRRRLAWTASGLLAVLLLGGFLGYHFLVTFATNPTHGNDPFSSSGREVFWADAIQIWRTSPWIGVGPGRFAFAYLQFAPSIPPGYWPDHAHDIFLQTLAEFGAVGLAAQLFLLASLAVWGWRLLRRASPRQRAWTAAILAGECGLLAQLVFDDLTFFTAVMVPAIFLLAWAGTKPSEPLPVFNRVSLAWLALPVLLVLGLSGWSLWAAQPYQQAIAAAQAGDLPQAAALSSLSVERDPLSYIDSTGAGLLWACQANTARDIPSLIRARAYLERTVQMEPNASWNWANLGMLEEAFGELDTAIRHMQRAVKLSTNLPSYWYNLGRFYEEASLPEMAIDSYQKALNLEPTWNNLAIWSETPARAQALGLWQLNPPTAAVPEDTDWRRAQAALDDGQLDEAARWLALARLLGEPQLEVTRVELALAEARNDSEVQILRDRLWKLTTQEQGLIGGLPTFPCPAFQGNAGEYGSIVVPGLAPFQTGFTLP